MSYCKRMVFFLFLQDKKNYQLEKTMEKKGKLLTAGYSKGWRNLSQNQLSALLDTASLEVVGRNVNDAFKTTFVKNVNIIQIDNNVEETVMIVKKQQM